LTRPSTPPILERRPEPFLRNSVPDVCYSFVVVSCALFILAASQLDRLALALSPGCFGCRFALLLHQAIYSRSIVLGFSLGIARRGLIAVRGS
jgi:hypothetical protein